jgi:tRNA (guanine10-N2)-dimethyltransferase
VIVGFVELSGEAPELARHEAIAAAEALGGSVRPSEFPGLVAVELPDREALFALAERVALARRCLERVAPDEVLARGSVAAGSPPRSAAFRRLGGSPGSVDAGVRAAGKAYRGAGGTIDLDSPARRFWLAAAPDGTDRWFEEVASVDRASATTRRMPLLPFQRPISLPPRLARAAANLARIRPGDRVVDPFLGTGALLAEAALLGAQTYGIDRDPGMVRGALRNFAHLGVEAEELVAGDSGFVEFQDPTIRFDALLTDPPYGRSAATGKEPPFRVVGRIVPRWAGRLRPGGRLVVILPGGSPEIGPPWTVRIRVPVRVHRSLTREFRVYERSD